MSIHAKDASQPTEQDGRRQATMQPLIGALSYCTPARTPNSFTEYLHSSWSHEMTWVLTLLAHDPSQGSGASSISRNQARWIMASRSGPVPMYLICGLLATVGLGSMCADVPRLPQTSRCTAKGQHHCLAIQAQFECLPPRNREPSRADRSRSSRW